MEERTFARVAGIASFVVAISAILYGVVFLFLVPPEQKSDAASVLRSLSVNPVPTQIQNLLLAVGAMAATIAVIGIFVRTGEGLRSIRILSLVTGAAYTTLTVVHGIYAVSLVPVISELYVKGDAAQQAAALVAISLPSQIDPNSFSKFFLSAIWLLLVGWLILRSTYFPRALGYLALAAGVGEILLFAGTIADSSFLILATGLPGTAIIGPLFWLWVGLAFWRNQ